MPSILLQILLALFICLTMIPGAQTACHYSCSTCNPRPFSPLSYAQCTSCFAPISIHTTLATTGYCSDVSEDGIAAIGALLLLVGTVSMALVRSKLLVHTLLILQTLGLASLVEIYWSNPIKTLVDGCRHLMFFSIMSRGSKDTPSIVLSTKSLVQLSGFLVEASLLKNIAPLFSLLILASAAILILKILSKLFRSAAILNSKFSLAIMVGCKTFILMVMQELMLIVYVSIRFGDLDGGEALVATMAIGLVLGFGVYCNLQPLPYFQSAATQNVMLAVKIIAPALVTLPYEHQYALLLFVPVLIIISGIFLFKAYYPPENTLQASQQLTDKSHQSKEQKLSGNDTDQGRLSPKIERSNTQEAFPQTIQTENIKTENLMELQNQQQAQSNLENKNFNHRMRFYGIYAIEMTVWLLLGCYYAVETRNNEHYSYAVAIVAMIFIACFLAAFFLWSLINLKSLLMGYFTETIRPLKYEDNYELCFQKSVPLTVDMKGTAKVANIFEENEVKIAENTTILPMKEKASIMVESVNEISSEEVEPVRSRRKNKGGKALIEARKAYQVLNIMKRVEKNDVPTIL